VDFQPALQHLGRQGMLPFPFRGPRQRAILLLESLLGAEEDFMTTATMHSALPSEVVILARVLSKDNSRLPPAMARYLLTLQFSEDDRVRMHDLAVRNQEDKLSAVEKEELLAFSKVGTLLSILKSNARLALRAKSKKRTTA
jgi:hypothetical protein